MPRSDQGFDALAVTRSDPLISDALQRPLRDLRISITDRCNLRCTYCMPRDVFGKDFVFLPRPELLSFEEIHKVAALFVQLGVRKIRLTGGEPLLRHGAEHLIEKLASLQGNDGGSIQTAMTTNGLLLPKKAQALKDAGLSRITVSLDSLSEKTFQRISDSRASASAVLDGIAAAQVAGFTSIKVNMVVKRGVNEDEIIPLVEHFRNTGIILRFIEFMDVGSSNGWRLDDVVTAREILQTINRRYPLRPIDSNYNGEVAKRWSFTDGGGEIGVIASVTQAFCHDCSRIRLSTDGKLYTCLFASDGIDVRDPLRREGSDAMLSRLITNTWAQRTDRYSQMQNGLAVRERPWQKIEMSYIGG